MARAVSQTRGKREIATTTPTASRSISPREDEQPEASPSRTRPRPSYTASLQSEDLKESSPAYASPPAETQFRSHGEDSDDQLWEADCILDERGAVATGQYLVQWVGNDPSTGSRWEPTWERREDVTPLLAKEWKDKKKADPSIVGVEGKKLELAIKAKREEAKKEKKRKRDEKANNARKKAKARSTPRGSEAGMTRSASVQVLDKDGNTIGKRSKRTLEVVVPRKSREFVDLTEDLSPAPVEHDEAYRYDQVDTPEPQSRIPKEAPDATEDHTGTEAASSSTKEPSELAAVAPRDPAQPSLAPFSMTANEEVARSDTIVKQKEDAPLAAGTQKRIRIESPPEAERLTSAAKMKNRVAAKTKQLAEKACEKAAAESETTVTDKEGESPRAEDPSSAKAPKVKVKILASVPVPTSSQFKALLPSSTVDSFQSTASHSNGIGPSHLDSIQQFSSPARAPQAANAEARQVVEEAEEVAQDSPASAVKIVKKVVDGEEVLAVESESDETESQAEGGKGQVVDDDESRDVFMADVVAVDEILAPVEASPVAPTRAIASAARSKALSEALFPLSEELFPESENQSSTQTADQGVVPPNQVGLASGLLQYSPDPTDKPPSKVNPKSRAIDHLEAALLRSSAGPSRLPVPNSKSVPKIIGKPKIASQAEADTRNPNKSQEPDWALRLKVLPKKSAEEYEKHITALHLLVAKLQTERIRSTPSPSSPEKESAVTDTAASKSRTPQRAPRISPPVVVAPIPTADSSAQTTTAPRVESTAAASQTEPEPAPAPVVAPTPGFTQAELDGKLAEKDAVTKKWRIRAKKAEAENVQSKEDLQFFREQYESASNSAVAEVAKSKTLSDQMDILQGQLKHGLKQREIHTAAIRAQYEKQVAKLTGANKILLDQSRRTDDTIRAKAAKLPRMELELERAQMLLKRAERKIADLTDRNDELLSQVEVLRAMQMGVLVEGADVSEDEDYSYHSDSGSERNNNNSPSPLKRTRLSTVKTEHRPDAEAASLTASQLMPDTQDLGPQSSTSVPNTLEASEGVLRAGPAYPSPWVEGVFLQDESAVKEHLMQEVDNGFM